MILLTSTSDKLQLITGSTGAVKVHASWVDNLSGAITPGRTNTASITTATTTDILASPASSTQRNAKFISVRNDHASTSNLVTIQHTDGTNVTPLWKGTLLAGESVNFNEGQGWQYLDANGNPKLAAAKLDTYLRTTGDVTNATTSFADITGLTCPVVSGKKYAFEAHIMYQTNASTTGARFGINGPTMTLMHVGVIDAYTPAVASAALASGNATALDTSAAGATTTGPGAVNAMAIVSGEIEPSADGTFAMRCASEIAVAGGLVIKQGSWLHVRELDN